jgi:hypothetical protein
MKPEIGTSGIRTTQTAARGITGTKLRIIGTQVIKFKVERKTFEHECFIAPIDIKYSDILGVGVLRHMEARVDLRTSTLVLGRTSYRLSGQKVEQCALIRRQPQVATGASEPGLINPGATRLDVSAGIPIPESSPGGPDIDSWSVVAHGPIVLPPLPEGLVIGKIEKYNTANLPGKILDETPGAYVARVASRAYT